MGEKKKGEKEGLSFGFLNDCCFRILKGDFWFDVRV